MKELILDPFVFSFLSSIFVFYFLFFSLRVNTNTKAKKLDSFLIALVFFLVTNSRLPPFTFLRPENLFASDKGIGIIVLQLGVYAICFFLLRSEYKSFPRDILSLLSIPFIGAFIGLIIFSPLWSETPMITLRGGLVVLGVSAFAVHIAKRYSWPELLEVLCWNNALVVCISLFLAILNPALGTSGKGWSGILTHPIDFGGLMAFTAVLWMLRFLTVSKGKLLSLGICGVSTVLMGLSNSAGAISIFVSLFFFLGLLNIMKRLSPNVSIATLVLLVAIGITATLFANDIFIYTLGLLGKDPSLTGRADIWPRVWEEALTKPILGHGYLGFWQPWRGKDDPAAALILANGYVPPHAHNGFLEVFLSLGIVGFMLFFLSLITNIRKSVELMITQKGKVHFLPILCLVYLVVLNLSQSSLLLPRYTWFYYIIISAKLFLREPVSARVGAGNAAVLGNIAEISAKNGEFNQLNPPRGFH